VRIWLVTKVVRKVTKSAITSVSAKMTVVLTQSTSVWRTVSVTVIVVKVSVWLFAKMVMKNAPKCVIVNTDVNLMTMIVDTNVLALKALSVLATKNKLSAQWNASVTNIVNVTINVKKILMKMEMPKSILTANKIAMSPRVTVGPNVLSLTKIIKMLATKLVTMIEVLKSSIALSIAIWFVPLVLVILKIVWLNAHVTKSVNVKQLVKWIVNKILAKSQMRSQKRSQKRLMLQKEDIMKTLGHQLMI